MSSYCKYNGFFQIVAGIGSNWYFCALKKRMTVMEDQLYYNMFQDRLGYEMKKLQ